MPKCNSPICLHIGLSHKRWWIYKNAPTSIKIGLSKCNNAWLSSGIPWWQIMPQTWIWFYVVIQPFLDIWAQFLTMTLVHYPVYNIYPCFVSRCLTHLPTMPHICVSESGQHWFRKWLVAYSAPSHYLNLCWFIVNWTLRNKLQWNFNQNTKLFIYENVFENICEMAAICSAGRWVKHVGIMTGSVLLWCRSHKPFRQWGHSFH